VHTTKRVEIQQGTCAIPGSPTWHGGSIWVQRSWGKTATRSVDEFGEALPENLIQKVFGKTRAGLDGDTWVGEWGCEGNGERASERAREQASKRERERPSFGSVAIPARMTSTPAGCQRSPGLSSSSTELLGRVRKYSPSSTCVPSDSSSSRTGSPGGTFSFSLPATHTHTHRIYTSAICY
jgi:hypothetical protein